VKKLYEVIKISFESAEDIEEIIRKSKKLGGYRILEIREVKDGD
jgi:ATP-dependent RNA circularization protein (DNA/RNA ligase family)